MLFPRFFIRNTSSTLIRIGVADSEWGEGSIICRILPPATLLSLSPLVLDVDDLVVFAVAVGASRVRCCMYVTS